MLQAASCMPLLAGLVQANCPQRIAKVHDQYLSFIALEGRLFSLGLPDSYLQLNDPRAQDTQIQVCFRFTWTRLTCSRRLLWP